MLSHRFWRRKATIAAVVGLCLATFAGAKDKKLETSIESDIEFGVKMAQRGLWKEALFRFQQADMQRPNDSRLLNNIAVAYEAVGAYDKALETYKRALQANASDRELKQNYSRFLEFYQAYKPEQPSEADKAATARAAEIPDEAVEAAEETEEGASTEEPESKGSQAENVTDEPSNSTINVADSPDSPSSSSGQ